MSREYYLKRRFLFGFIAVLLITLVSTICLVVCAADDSSEVSDSGSTADTDANQSGRDKSFANWLNPNRDYLTIVNEQHEYIFGGEYDKALQSDLVNLKIDSDGNTALIEKATCQAFKSLKQYLYGKDGIAIRVYSAYRTKEDQQWVYNYYGNLEGWADTNRVAEPGFSEHHTGLLVNIIVWWPKIQQWATETPVRTAEDPEFFGKIHARLADYGFIDRYPAGKEEITGYPAEPYEIRFVGSSEVAHEIMDNGLCLEEYLASKE